MSVYKSEVIIIGTGAINANSASPQVASSNIAIGIWSSAITYAVGNLVEYSGVVYRSLIASNLNNEPDINPADWETVLTTVNDGDIVLVKNGTSSNIQIRIGGAWVSIVETPVQVALLGNQASPQPAITYVGANLPYVKITYTVMTALGREKEGVINILNDGSATVQWRNTFGQIGTPINVIFSVSISGGNVSLNYTSVGESTPITLKYTMTGWY